MKNSFYNKFEKTGSLGGIIGALLGALLSVFSHKPDENPVHKAGKTAVFSGAGFLAGHWIERLFKKSKDQ